MTVAERDSEWPPYREGPVKWHEEGLRAPHGRVGANL
jgi:hypothetical protein